MTLALALGCSALLAYRLLWHRLNHLPAWTGVDAVRHSGTIAGGHEGLLVLAPADGGELVPIATSGAKVVAWPAPGAWRISRGLRLGDPVTVLVLESEQDGERSAARIVRGRWPDPPLERLPSAIVAIVLGITLLQLFRAHVEVDREIAVPSASPFLLDAPDPIRVYEATRHMAAAHAWAGNAQTTPGRDGETFLEYVGSQPNVADAQRRYLYVQPIGPFEGARQAHILRLTSRFLARFYCLPVRVARELPLSEISRSARRLHPDTAHLQLQSTYLIHNLLRWRRPREAAIYLGITAVDIWPGPGWEAVYGQASLIKRVGVLSIYRHGDLDGGPSRFRLALVRTLKVAAHESGHTLSMKHCANRGCLMSGHNDREEADQRFPVLCPDCLAKLLWATRCDPVQRYSKLAAYCWKNHLRDEASIYAQLLSAAVKAWGEPDRPGNRLAVSY
jgi:archaemetzincin